MPDEVTATTEDEKEKRGEIIISKTRSMNSHEWYDFWYKENKKISEEAKKNNREIKSGEKWYPYSYLGPISRTGQAERTFYNVTIKGMGAFSGFVHIFTVPYKPNDWLGPGFYKIQIDTAVKVTSQVREAIARAVVPSDLFNQPQTKPKPSA